jgi:hypothetical protein
LRETEAERTMLGAARREQDAAERDRDLPVRTLREEAMCLTCGCMQAHLEMGEHNIRYEDVKAAADENGQSVAETLDIIDRTVAIDRGDHPEEYARGS